MYLIDTFTIYAASALAANAVMRSIAGAVLPLAGLPMYEKLGMGWGNSLLGLVYSLPFLPVQRYIRLNLLVLVSCNLPISYQRVLCPPYTVNAVTRQRAL